MGKDSGAQVYPGKSPFAMRSVPDCIADVLRLADRPLDTVSVSLGAARGLVLARDVVAPAPVPAFPASIMDGFAVRAADGAGRFPVDDIEGGTAGGAAIGALAPGHVRYITTGARLPEGADAVVQVEHAGEVREGGQLLIDIGVTSKVGANIRKVGSDTAQGETVLRSGSKIGAGEIGVLAALGFPLVETHRRPRMAFLSTGDELRDISESLARDESRGQIVDCNRPMLQALVEEAGADPVDCGIVRDEPGSLRSAVLAALESSDIIVSSGGVSRGSKDHMKALLSELGEIHFGEMCMKPGKPSTFASVPHASGRPRLVFALPGNPVSCFVTFKLLVVPALERLAGRPVSALTYPRVDVELAQSVDMDAIRPEYHRAMARWQDSRIVAVSTGFQRSSRVVSVASANCVLEIPKGTGSLPKGTVVKALLFSGLAAAPGGYPEPCEPAPILPGVAPKRAAEAMQQSVAVPPRPVQALQSRPWRVALLVVGPEGLAAEAEVGAWLRAAAVEDARLLREEVAPKQEDVSAAIVAFCGGSGADARADLVIVLASLGLSDKEAAVAEAVRGLLHRDAPGVVSAMLRAGMQRTPLAMLSQGVAGRRHNTFVCTLSHVAAAEGLQAIWPLLPYAVP